jgi:hypothetical protein
MYFKCKNHKQLYHNVNCRGKAGQRRSRKRILTGIPAQIKSYRWKKAVIASKQRVINSTYVQVKRDSNPKFKFNLTLEQFDTILFNNCHYCGSAPSIKTKSGKLLRNGIDRIDPFKNYTESNCVPSCWMCNRMKWQWSTDEFLAQVAKIYKHLIQA